MSAFFQQEVEGKYYTHPLFSDVYLIVAVVLPFVSIAFLSGYMTSYPFIGFICLLLEIELLQYQFRIIILRPFFQKEYKPYAAERTLLVVLVQYFQTIFIFSVIYLTWFHDCFSIDSFGAMAALEFSAITITTVGFGSIYPQPGTPAGLVAAAEGIIGIFFIGLMVALTASRIRDVRDVGE